MITVNIFDNTCQHHLREDGYWTSTANRKPQNIQFIQRQFEYDGITLFTDDNIFNDDVDRVKSKIKVAWCLESPAVQRFVHENIEQVAHKFDYIFTYREDLIKKNPIKFKPNSPGGTWLQDKDIYTDQIKNKLCSMIISGKRAFEGHIFRHRIQEATKGVDYYGWGTPAGLIDNKSDAMRDYMYHITIENARHYHYFTEKLIDCLLMKCIPIYWGCLNIGDYFNTKGFYIINGLSDLKELTNQLKNPKEIYNNKREIIEENFNLAKNYISSDDYLASKLAQL